jgi:hypothetical protein
VGPHLMTFFDENRSPGCGGNPVFDYVNVITKNVTATTEQASAGAVLPRVCVLRRTGSPCLHTERGIDTHKKVQRHALCCVYLRPCLVSGAAFWGTLLDGGRSGAPAGARGAGRKRVRLILSTILVRARQTSIIYHQHTAGNGATLAESSRSAVGYAAEAARGAPVRRAVQTRDHARHRNLLARRSPSWAPRSAAALSACSALVPAAPSLGRRRIGRWRVGVGTGRRRRVLPHAREHAHARAW